jgi:hypothetical protein
LSVRPPALLILKLEGREDLPSWFLYYSAFALRSSFWTASGHSARSFSVFESFGLRGIGKEELNYLVV